MREAKGARPWQVPEGRQRVSLGLAEEGEGLAGGTHEGLEPRFFGHAGRTATHGLCGVTRACGGGSDVCVEGCSVGV